MITSETASTKRTSYTVQLTVYRTPSNREGRHQERVGRAFWDDYQGWMPKAMVTRKQAAAEIRAHRNNARRGEPQTGAERTR